MGAVGTKGGYRRSIYKLLQLTGFFGADITIYSDQDVSLEEYHKALDNTIKPSSNIKIYYRVNTDRLRIKWLAQYKENNRGYPNLNVTKIAFIDNSLPEDL